MPQKIVKQEEKSKKKMSKKAKILVVSGITVGVLAIIVAVVLCFLKPWEKKETRDDDEASVVAIERVDGTDYAQKITTVDGGEFTPKITEGTSDNLAMRFSELSCNDECKNIENVKLGDKTLKAGEDYEVKKGSVIIILFAKVFSDAQPGEVTLTFEIQEGSKIKTIGVKITIEKKEEKKEDQKPAENAAASTDGASTGGSSSTSSGGSSSNAVDAAKVACESRADGPISFTTFHFPSSAEKKNWIATYAPDYKEEDVYVLYTWFSGSPAPMHYVNGTCLPSISSASDWIGVGAQPLSKAQLQAKGITRTQDFIRWAYASGRVEDQVTTDFNSPWRW